MEEEEADAAGQEHRSVLSLNVAAGIAGRQLGHFRDAAASQTNRLLLDEYGFER